jgi:hypothetical protein
MDALRVLQLIGGVSGVRLALRAKRVYGGAPISGKGTWAIF